MENDDVNDDEFGLLPIIYQWAVKAQAPNVLFKMFFVVYGCNGEDWWRLLCSTAG